jgi:hypothetical protein
LESHDSNAYQLLCASITTQFAQVSQQINAIENTLINESQRKDIAALIRQVQQNEKVKLTLVGNKLLHEDLLTPFVSQTDCAIPVAKKRICD